jgi:hypothetical protein
MKPGPERDKKGRHSPSKEVRCPFFKSYYIGVCAAHRLPYTPSREEKKMHCFHPEFNLCSIYAKNISGNEQ